MVKHIPTVEGIGSFGDYSPVSIADGIVAVAGQFGTDTEDPAGQVRGAFANVGKALAAVGLGFEDVIKFTTFVVGRETIPHFMATRKEVFAEIFPDGVYPPNTLLVVAGLVEERFVVEIEALAQPKALLMATAALPFSHGRDQVISYPVTVNGVRTRVVESHGGTTPLICLHGVGSRADRFIPVIPGLVAAGFRVFAIDFPGHGFADKTGEIDYRPKGFADFVAGVLDELGLADAVIAGTSLGGQVAARLACDRPDLVTAVVLIGTMGLSELAEADKVAPENVSNGSIEAVTRKLGFLVSDPAMVTDAWVREESMINSSAGAAEALAAAAALLNAEANNDRQDARVRAERPDLPVLIVWGEDDRWTPLAMGQQAHELLPGSHLVVMPGCGHAPYFEDPASFVEIVSEFVVKEGIR